MTCPRHNTSRRRGHYTGAARVAAGLTLLLTMVAAIPAASGNNAEAMPPVPTELRQPDTVQNEWKRRLRQVEPAVNVSDMVAFYQLNNPWTLADLDWLCAQRAPELQQQLQLHAEEFFRLESLRSTSPPEYLRMVHLQRLNSQSRQLGYDLYRMQRQHNKQARVSEDDKIAVQKQLETVLAEIFEHEQKNQTVEIMRLEAELRELRRLLSQRKARKQQILDRRLLELSNYPVGTAAKLQP